MKLNFALILLFAFYIFSSCNKDTLASVSSDAGRMSDDAAVNHVLSTQMVEHSYQTDFLQNNLCFTMVKTPPTKQAPLVYKLMKLHSLNEEKLIANYPEVKKLIIEDALSNQGSYSRIQYAIQNHIRNHLLLTKTDENKNEVAFWLKFYLPTQPVDLDVLADGFIFAKSHMNEEDASTIENYIRNKIAENDQKLASKYETYRKRFEEAEHISQKNFQLMGGLSIQRQIESTAYATALINGNNTID